MQIEIGRGLTDRLEVPTVPMDSGDNAYGVQWIPAAFHKIKVAPRTDASGIVACAALGFAP